MKVIIDYDSAVYAIASACDCARWEYRGRTWESKAIAVKALEAEGKETEELIRVINPEPWENVERTIHKYTDNLLSNLNNPFDVELLVSGGGGNFRYEIATIFPYKANRIQELPYHFQAVKDYLVEAYDARRVYGVEVDDAVGILYKEATDLIVSPDKDLDQFPGLHYNPQSGKDYEVKEVDALRNFYSQVVTGDTSDNIPGLFGIGASSAYLKSIKKMDNEEEMFELVSNLYRQRFGSYYPQFLLENCRLLFLLRNPNTFEPPFWMRELLADTSFYLDEPWEEKIFERV